MSHMKHGFLMCKKGTGTQTNATVRVRGSLKGQMWISSFTLFLWIWVTGASPLTSVLSVSSSVKWSLAQDKCRTNTS